MSISATIDVVATPGHGDVERLIDTDFPCACGYNLRGLSLLSRCPECGRDITSSFSRGLQVDRRWARKVAWGAVLLIFFVAPPTRAHTMISGGGATLYYSILIAACVAGAIGAWLVSARDPDAKRTVTDTGLRWIVRLTCGGWFLVAAVVFNYRTPWVRADLFPLLYYGLNAAALYAVLAQLENVALRLSCRGLARWLTVLRFAFPVATTVLGVMAVARQMFEVRLPHEATVVVLLSQHMLSLAAIFVFSRLYQVLRSAPPHDSADGELPRHASSSPGAFKPGAADEIG